MTKKRRMFDIDLPEEDGPELEVKSMGDGLRRGPMATAIGENAESLRQRQAAEAEIRAENDALAHEFVRLKKLGLVVDMIPVDQVHAGKLIRDRSRRVDPELDELKASIRAVGLSNPIRVEQVGEGQYELVQGWRRLSAYRELLAETGDQAYARIPAGLMARGETLDSLYRRMVDENMVRKDISFAEMANLARAYAEDDATGCRDLDEAVNILFATANPQKRSYVRRFAFLMRALEKVLEHPESIPRALGLTLANRIEGEPAAVTALARMLGQGRRTAEEELAILRRFAEGEAAPPAAGAVARAADPRGKTVLRMPTPAGEVKCTAAAGKVELRLDRDFSTLDRRQLEAAVKAFFSALD
ncbi:replication protein [Tabrizicola sp. TH137]|uniref:ParB/RepB/Spo0J family partition protein n=1 Tax=Tabrizicola sp. TH137 TaxID=2067452 RepID=UPI000C7A43A3|nr:ParB N-terminal domain-containing protein [Tabrizicola sp. TH137]PLL10645.1 replication protein [Tabrizicola sp. TH137]